MPKFSKDPEAIASLSPEQYRVTQKGGTEIAGPADAQTQQLIMEYFPQPPFDAGSPEKAGPETLQRAFGAMVEMMQTLAARAAS